MKTQDIATLPFKTAREILEESQDNSSFPASGVMKIKHSLPKEGFVYCQSTTLYILGIEGTATVQMKDKNSDTPESTSVHTQTVITIPAGKLFRLEGDIVIILMSETKESFTLMKA